MNDRMYPNSASYPNLNNIYGRPPCAKQVLEPNQQQFYSYSMPINNSYTQSNNLVDNYNMVSPQNCLKSQNVCMYPSSQLDPTNWDSRLCEDNLKIPDKIDMIEITSRDLSPASYCSNLDLIMPEFYKTLGKDMNYYNKYEGQYYNAGSCSNNQKMTDYPSCAQSVQNLEPAEMEKSVKYCSIQKSQEFDYTSGTKNYCFNSDLTYSDQNFSNCYYDKLQDPLQNQYYQLQGCTEPAFPSLPGIDQQTEGSNDESDIIVEESDDDVTDCNDYDDKKLPTPVNRCVICNVSYTPLGTQFYYLTLKSPLSMTSQKPVYSMLVGIVGKICTDVKYLCSECLGLINTIDHLQLKLDGFRAELLLKFQKTCAHNQISYQKFGKKQKKLKARHNLKFKCRLCKKVLSMKDYCHTHLRKHKFKGFLCEFCGKIWKNKAQFNTHYQVHVVKVPKIDPYKCSGCTKCFRTKSNLTEHENYCLGLLPFACKFCEKKFPTTTKLKNHVKLKHDKKFIAICSICNIGFVKLSDYKSHKISHSTDKKFTCSKCDKSYKTLSNLNFHMKMHNGKLPFICEICDKGFMRKEYLEAHLNNHRGIKNFACNLCEKKFVSQKNLDSHLKFHDGSTKPRTCHICGKILTSGFEEHLRIHSNLREFECDLCDNRFNTKGTLSKHKKRKHSEVQ